MTKQENKQNILICFHVKDDENYEVIFLFV